VDSTCRLVACLSEAIKQCSPLFCGLLEEGRRHRTFEHGKPDRPLLNYGDDLEQVFVRFFARDRRATLEIEG
jgi:hypothetical protein